jgi:hypothetical protein
MPRPEAPHPEVLREAPGRVPSADGVAGLAKAATPRPATPRPEVLREAPESEAAEVAVALRPALPRPEVSREVRAKATRAAAPFDPAAPRVPRAQATRAVAPFDPAAPRVPRTEATRAVAPFDPTGGVPLRPAKSPPALSGEAPGDVLPADVFASAVVAGGSSALHGVFGPAVSEQSRPVISAEVLAPAVAPEPADFDSVILPEPLPEPVPVPVPIASRQRRRGRARWVVAAASVVLISGVVVAGIFTVQSAQARDRLTAAAAELAGAEAVVASAEQELDAAAAAYGILAAAATPTVGRTGMVLDSLAGLSDDSARGSAQGALDALAAHLAGPPAAAAAAFEGADVDDADPEALLVAADDAIEHAELVSAAAAAVRVDAASLDDRTAALRTALLMLGGGLPAFAERIVAENALPGTPLRDAVVVAAHAAAIAGDEDAALAAMESYAAAVIALRGEQARLAEEQSRLREAAEQRQHAPAPRSQPDSDGAAHPAPDPAPAPAPAPGPGAGPAPEPEPEQEPEPEPEPESEPEPEPGPDPRDWPWPWRP